MKKHLLISSFVLVAFCLTAFGFKNWNNNETDYVGIPYSKIALADGYSYQLNTFTDKADFDLVYDVDSRYINTITMENLINAKSIIDILPAKATKSIESYQSFQVDIIDKASESGEGHALNAAQLKLLQSADYSTDIYIKSNYKTKSSFTDKLVDRYLTYFITIIPEKEAELKSGKDALIAYIKENTKEFKSIVERDKLQPGKVTFSVTKAGIVADATLTSTSGYPLLDKKMVDLISSLPSTWEPASNFKGEKVEQTLVFFFGIIGC